MFLESKDFVWEKIDENLERALIGFDDSLMQTIVRFKKEESVICTIIFILNVLSLQKGSFEVQIENEKKILSAGDSFFVPSELVHGVVCLEDGILVESFSPARKDFFKLNI